VRRDARSLSPFKTGCSLGGGRCAALLACRWRNAASRAVTVRSQGDRLVRLDSEVERVRGRKLPAGEEALG
jgi:hypothetical protein